VTALSAACESGSGAIVSRLLDAGADPNTRKPTGATVLMLCARAGDLQAVEALLAKGADVNAAEPLFGQTALHWAAAAKHARTVELLVTSGANIHRATGEGPPLPNDTRQLATPTDYFTPLMFAVRSGDFATVKTLLRLGASPSDTAGDGTTTLVMALLNGHFELAAYLLDLGVDPNAYDQRGSALHVIVWIRRQAEWISIAAADIVPRVPDGNLDSLGLARKLLDKGANPNVRIALVDPNYRPSLLYFAKRPADLSIERNYLGWDGATPFWLAARHADVEYMRLLASRGADPTIPTRLNITPLMAAAGAGFQQGGSPGTDAEALEATRMALELGNDVNAVADYGGVENTDPRFDGLTALHGAATRGAVEVIRLLVSHGARLDAQTKEGWTPFNIADGIFIGGTFKGNPVAAEVLKQMMVERGITVVDRRPVVEGKSPPTTK
jgi:ankyrin repeat protein